MEQQENSSTINPAGIIESSTGKIEVPEKLISAEVKKEIAVIQQEEPAKIDLIGKLEELPIKLISEDIRLNFRNLRSDAIAPSGSVLVCDAAIRDEQKDGIITLQGIDRDPEAQFIKWGYRKYDDKGEILNIDHHFRTSDFYQRISSTNLAIGYVQEYGSVGKEYTVIINHKDCDSILSSLVMRGILPPKEEYGKVAIAADHTGEANPIADLLQACEHEGNFEFSLKNLQRLLNNEDLEPEAKELLEKRRQQREKAVELASKAKYALSGRIAYIETDEITESVLFPALLPTAEFIVIVCARAMKDRNGNQIPGKQAKVVLGMSAKPGINVANIVRQFDPEFGGRWNAGSNDRSRGFTLSSIEEYVGLLEKHLVDIEKST